MLERFAQELHCDGFEFMMYNSWYERLGELKAFMSRFSDRIYTFHVEKDVGNLISRDAPGDTEEALRLFRENCALAAFFGVKKLVLHLWGSIDSDKNFRHNMDIYPRLREISDAYGLSLMVENVVCNRADPMTHLIELAKAYPDIRFTFDTKMAEFHKQTELLYRAENRWLFPHMQHMHVNDYAGGYMDWQNLRTLHIGDGHVDFARFFAFCKAENYTGDFTVEATSFDQTGAVDIASLNKSFEKIKQYIN